ncbi:MAG: hypothetical protein AB7T49_15365 [Oligoflexales bacterium]
MFPFRIALLLALAAVGCRHQKSELSTTEIITESTYVQRVKELAEAAPCVGKAEFKERKLIITPKQGVNECPITYLEPFLERTESAKAIYNVFMSPREIALKLIKKSLPECVDDTGETDVGFKFLLKKDANAEACTKKIGDKLATKLLLTTDGSVTFGFVSAYVCKHGDAEAIFVRDLKNDNEFINNLTLSYASFTDKQRKYEFHHCDLTSKQDASTYLCLEKTSRQIMELKISEAKIQGVLDTDQEGTRAKKPLVLTCSPET